MPEITTQVIVLAAGLAVILGAITCKTNFCTMGAVSDWVNMGDTRRMRAWFLAIAVALIGVLIVEAMGTVDINDSRVPYRSSIFMWPRYLLGGLMFGIGMTLCSGCANRNLVRVGGGNLKSILVLLVAGAMAYLMNKTDFYATVFHSWMQPISPDLATHGIQSQELSTLLGGLIGFESSGNLHLVVGALIAALLLFVIFRASDFRGSVDNILGGAVVGLVVFGGWYLTGGPMGQEWMEAVDFMDDPPPGVGVQSYTFIAPLGDLLVYLSSPAATRLITFGVAAVMGVAAGSFFYAIVSGNFRIEWFSSFTDFVRHMAGAVLIGIGGVLALGCTIGQGVTGVSTLALGSFMALGSIILGSALTMKVEYYRMVYEAEATFGKALVTGLVDLRLLPAGMRKLEAV